MREIIWFIIIITSLITLLYPIIMSFLWLLGGIIFNLQRRNEKVDYNLSEMPIDIVIPVYNEGAKIADYIMENLKVNYQNYRLIIIDDCSTDDSYTHILKAATLDKKIEVYQMQHNSGKANVLNYAIKELVQSRYFLCIDSDAIIDKDALKVLNSKIQSSKTHYSAITGYPNILNDGKDLVHSSQKIEYSAIIGTIKKAQSIFGSIMTVSGVCTAYCTKDISDVGYFDTINATEDIEITWRLQRNNYKVLFLPEMIVNMYSPDYVFELLTQRARWSLGGLQTFLKNKDIIFKRKNIMLKFFLMEALFSTVWTLCFIISTFFIFFMAIYNYPSSISSTQIIDVFCLMFTISIIYLLGSYLIDKGKKESIFSFSKVLLFYPFIYWFVYPIGYLMGFVRLIKSVFSKGKTDGTWRGSNSTSEDTMYIKIRYVIALFYDLLMILVSYWFMRSILLEFVAPFLKSDKQHLFFLILFIMIFSTIFIFVLIYYPLRYGATPGQKLLGIMRVSKHCKKINILQALISPIFITFLISIFSRISFLAVGLAALRNGDSADFYYQYINITEFFIASSYQTLAFILFFILDALLINVVNKISRTKVIRAYTLDTCSIGSKKKKSILKKLVLTTSYILIISFSIYLYYIGSEIRYLALFPNSVSCTSREIMQGVVNEFELSGYEKVNEDEVDAIIENINQTLNKNYESENLDIYIAKDNEQKTTFGILDFTTHTGDYKKFMEEIAPYLYMMGFEYSIEKETNRIYIGHKEMGNFSREMRYVDKMTCG